MRSNRVSDWSKLRVAHTDVIRISVLSMVLLTQKVNIYIFMGREQLINCVFVPIVFNGYHKSSRITFFGVKAKIS